MKRKSVLLTFIGLIFGLWHSTNGVCTDRIAFKCFRGPDAEICTVNPNGTGQNRDFFDVKGARNRVKMR
ncbi:hypothetical protein C6499_20630 [Candidatus Poribacteria bacterium]|nr:MAG: hypothetical protein C6499_20630 [Candidatus Poribacteria bacterium]